MINSRKLEDLTVRAGELAQAFIDRCATEAIDVIITSTYRDLESQAALYAQGRSTPGNVVTNARPGQSFHNYRVAFDFCPLVGGKAQWNDLALFGRCGLIAEEVGLEWAGRWKSMRETAHCQFTGGRSLADFRTNTLAG